MEQLIACFGIGLVGSLHCLGMCGPLVLAYSLNLKSADGPPWGGKVALFQNGLHHLAFHLGRLVAYGFLGALAALLFYAADLDRLFINIRGSMTLLGGSLMVVLGFVLLRVLPLPRAMTRLFAASGSQWGKRLSPLFQSQKVGSKMALGLAAGFLPCGLSWAMILKAGTTQNAVTGWLTMLAFGLGTVPALFLTGFSVSFLSSKARAVGDRIAALSIITMGSILVFKGARIFV